MKRKEKETLRSMSIEELQKQAQDTERKIVEWSLKRFSEQPKNTREGKIGRQRLAIIQTILQGKLLQKNI